MEVVFDHLQLESILEKHTEKVNAIIDSYKGKKEMLISLLQDIQGEYSYLPRDVLIRVSEKLDISLSQVFSVATFFKSFHLKPRGRHIITVCVGTACHVRGAQRLVDCMERDYNLKPGGTTEDARFTLETVNCLGACALAPVAVVDGEYSGQMNANKISKLLKKYK